MSNPEQTKELVRRLLADTCEICQSSGEVEVHQIKALTELATFGEPLPDWTRIMRARRRKTLVVCRDCHDRVHHR
ncbi:RNA-directed DNA polymerase [Glycomyces tenuis]|uniref:HNH endonuclease n=1 Tax=Glycomyces tenuis TaxID=58116 RepID=UPI00316ACC04